jgi:uncharacterized membrane protein YcjF (UPF0283 family)
MWLKIFGAVAVLVGIILIFEGENLLKKFFDKTDEDNYARVGIKALGVMLALLRRIANSN